MLRDSNLRFDRPSLASRLAAVAAALLCGVLVAGLRGPGGQPQVLAEDVAQPPATTSEGDAVVSAGLCHDDQGRPITVYDAAADLTEASIDNGGNPNGVWSYGYRKTAASTEFTPLPVHGQFPWYQPGLTGLKGWFDASQKKIPAVLKNTTDKPLVGGYFWETKGLDEVIVPPGGLMLHPGIPANNRSYAVLRWTAPASATVDVAVTFTGIDYVKLPVKPFSGGMITGSGGGYVTTEHKDGTTTKEIFTTTDVHVVKNGVSLFDAEVTGGLPAATNAQTHSVHGMAVAAGDIVDFIVGPGPGGRFECDSTGVSVQISAPENQRPNRPDTVTSAPMAAMLQAAKISDAAAFRDAYSKRIREDNQQSDWGKNLQMAQAALKEKFGDYELTDFTYSFEGDDLKGKLAVSFKGKQQVALAIVKEDDAWKLDER